MNTSSVERDVMGSIMSHNITQELREVDIAPAFGEITTACNVGQAKSGSWCLLEE